MAEPFKIGLVGAGAISAGAYTAGVVDFMVQALDCWYDDKRTQQPDTPPHDVTLNVFSGASAGGITAALAAGMLASDQPPIANEQDAAAKGAMNKLYSAWVEGIDISSLLQAHDLRAKSAEVVSLLDSTVLTKIADSGLDVAPRPQRRAYVAPQFDLLLTVTNLRGVPYAFALTGQHAEKYRMSVHADYMHFRIGEGVAAVDHQCYAMPWSEFGAASSPAKAMLKTAALASGAFPIGLAPRGLSHQIDKSRDYYGRRTYSDGEFVAAEWPQPLPKDPYPYEFQCVDGGVMNNEPLELARRMLAGEDGRNPREGKDASRAVLLIDPFPHDENFADPYRAPPDILKTALSLFGALKNQARFKPEELALAIREDVYSRFLIAPSRDKGSEFPIACGALGGFGGFLKRDFRKHDFFLGRRNAQKFLKDHFVLPDDNPLFARWSETMKARHGARDSTGQPRLDAKSGRPLLPIVPLIGDARTECVPLPWPVYTDKDLEQVRGQIAQRVDAVVGRLIASYFDKHPIAGFFIGPVLRGKKAEAVDYAVKAIAKDLRKMNLMT